MRQIKAILPLKSFFKPLLFRNIAVLMHFLHLILNFFLFGGGGSWPQLWQGDCFPSYLPICGPLVIYIIRINPSECSPLLSHKRDQPISVHHFWLTIPICGLKPGVHGREKWRYRKSIKKCNHVIIVNVSTYTILFPIIIRESQYSDPLGIYDH